MKSAKKSPPALAPLFESFERRLMMSATLAAGTLTVTGTNNADTIKVNFQMFLTNKPANGDDTITVDINGATQTFETFGLKNIVINGLAGNDTVTETGYAEDDSLAIVPLTLNTTINGGDGNDNISTSVSSTDATLSTYVDGGNGDDVIYLQGGDMATVHGGDGNDTISTAATSSDFVGYLYGDDGNDSFYAGSSGDAGQYLQMSGGNGNDNFTNSDADDHITVSGGAGTDAIVMQESTDSSQGPIALDGQQHAGSNYFIGTDVENVVGRSDDTNLEVIGNASNNYLGVSLVGGGLLTLVGGDGNDTLNASYQDNLSDATTYLYGGNGNDLLIGSVGVNHYFGGAGTDSVDYTKRSANLKIYLDGSQPSGDPNESVFDYSTNTQLNGEHDTFDGTVEQVFGGSGNDLIVATKSGGDALFGFAGNDTLVAQGGVDALFGGDGNDTFQAKDGGFTYIDGGAGYDTAKADSFDVEVNVEKVTN